MTTQDTDMSQQLKALTRQQTALHDLCLKTATMVEAIERQVLLNAEMLRTGAGTGLDPKEQKAAAAKLAHKAQKEAILDALSASDRELFEALRRWRAETAATEGYSTMIVSKDDQLLNIVAVRPRNELQLRAVAPKLVEKYGSEELLTIVQDHPSDEPW